MYNTGGIGLYDADSNIVFTGDTLYTGYLIDSAIDSDSAAYDASMDKLAEMNVDKAYPGHGEILTGAQYLGVIDCYFNNQQDCTHVLDNIPTSNGPSNSETPASDGTNSSGGNMSSSRYKILSLASLVAIMLVMAFLCSV